MNPTEKTYVPYKGTATPGNAEEVVLFSSTVAFGPRCAQHYRIYWVDVDLSTTEAAGTQTVRLEKSVDGGTTWTTVGTPTAVGDATSTKAEFFVSPYQDFRIVYLNGTTPQGAFHADLVLDHSSRSSQALPT